MFKKALSLLIAIGMILAIGGVAFAEDETPGSMHLQGEYVLDGDINWKTLAGTDTTGGQRGSLAKGQGTVMSNRTIDQQIGELNVNEEIAFETANSHPFDSLVVKSATVANFPDDTESAQMYGSYMSPNQGEVGYVSESVRVTQAIDDEAIDDEDFNYVDSFVVDYEGELSDGIAKRFIEIEGEISETYTYDYIDVDGSASIKEAFELFDTQIPVEAAIQWFDLF